MSQNDLVLSHSAASLTPRVELVDIFDSASQGAFTSEVDVTFISADERARPKAGGMTAAMTAAMTGMHGEPNN